jgi:hypothetical protein
MLAVAERELACLEEDGESGISADPWQCSVAWLAIRRELTSYYARLLEALALGKPTEDVREGKLLREYFAYLLSSGDK